MNTNILGLIFSILVTNYSHVQVEPLPCNGCPRPEVFNLLVTENVVQQQQTIIYRNGHHETIDVDDPVPHGTIRLLYQIYLTNFTAVSTQIFPSRAGMVISPEVPISQPPSLTEAFATAAVVVDGTTNQLPVNLAPPSRALRERDFRRANNPLPISDPVPPPPLQPSDFIPQPPPLPPP